MSKLKQYLETNSKANRNDPDKILSDINSLLMENGQDDLLDLIITYGDVREKKGYDNGYEQAQRWADPTRI